jgi:hypothetical protein
MRKSKRKGTEYAHSIFISLLGATLRSRISNDKRVYLTKAENVEESVKKLQLN